jgi:CubicO group peptidase (beta-lactamase class C family)
MIRYSIRVRAALAGGLSAAAGLVLWCVGGGGGTALASDVAASAQGKPAPAAPASPSAGAAMTAADVEAFLEGIVPTQLAREDIAGAVVVVVKDGRVLFGKGYGFADVENRKPVSVDDTLFRPGSTSKLFTWTAVMQQVEQGKLDLDKDVNTYLDFKVPEAFGKPITLRDIMTHTPGYEDYVRDLFTSDPKRIQQLGLHLKTHQPARIYPPGTTGAYSNYATAMAGYIVERVSGKPFDDYIEEFITKPLGMTRATFRQPLPADLEPLMSKGYRLGSGKPEKFELVNPSPAGAMSASGGSMARFMIAHLQDGRFEGTQILKPETAQLMHARQRGKSPTMNAMCLGFYEESRNGHRIISHGGDTQWFHSDLHLMPDAGLGFFVSYNSGGKGEISGRTQLWESFLDRYYPYSPPATTAAKASDADIAAVTGSYLSSRRSEKTFLRLLYLLLETKVAAGPDHTIEVSDFKGFNGKPLRFEQVGPMVFQEVHGQNRIEFRKDDVTGRLEGVTGYPFFAFIRPTGLRDRAILLPVAIVSLALLLLTLILWPIGALVRRHYGRKLELPDGERRLRRWVRFICVLDLVLVATYAWVTVGGLSNIDLFSSKLDPWLRVMQVLAFLAIVAAIVALWNMIRSWGSRARGVWSKLGETLIALACVGMAWLVLAGGLLHVGKTY